MDQTAIDEAVYRELQATAGAEFVVDLVRTFLDEAPGMLAGRSKARLEGDGESFRRTAHSLKSNGITFGARGLAALARELEQKGLDADSSRDAQRLSALQSEYARAEAALKALIDG